MSILPFIKRELVSSIRRGSARADRLTFVILTAVIVVICFAAWDWNQQDRSSVYGARWFAVTIFGLVIAAQVFLAMFQVPGLIAPAIAAERDKKSLDALLATRFNSAEIVLGTMFAGLIRYANCLAALVPLVTLMIYLGGINPWDILIVTVGLVSLAFVLAALSIAISAGARTAQRAVSYTALVALSWLSLPMIVVMILPRIWPAAAQLLAPLAVQVLDSSPVGILMSITGVMPRGTLAEVLLKMIGLQTAAALLLLFWATNRLRRASRAVYDVEGQTALRRILKARWRPRPPCGQDPVLWRELYQARLTSNVVILIERIISMCSVIFLIYATSWFAVPAFTELFRNGYGPSPGTPVMPELSPLARVVIGKLTSMHLTGTPGEARLEFNMALRQATAAFQFLFVLVLAGAGAESIVKERERETWLGLIATPLSGWEIIRAKMLGAVWKGRSLGILIISLWTIGLLAGAVHPFGFVASVVGMAVACWFLTALGVSASLWSSDRNHASYIAIAPLLIAACLGSVPFIPQASSSILLAVVSIPFQTWAGLLSYDDVHAIVNSRIPMQFSVIGIKKSSGLWVLLNGWMLSTFAQILGALYLTRAASNGFDAAIGRPVRPK